MTTYAAETVNIDGQRAKTPAMHQHRVTDFMNRDDKEKAEPQAWRPVKSAEQKCTEGRSPMEANRNPAEAPNFEEAALEDGHGKILLTFRDKATASLEVSKSATKVDHQRKPNRLAP